MSLCRRRLSACGTVWLADHFLPVLVSTNALWTMTSIESSYVITSLALVTLYSSTNELNGSCSRFDRP
ncbi:hypothetical protein DPMN_061882 [Dreissena polymorpha]|uniref:Uncharacterized protein n=1 Tax=Dreissena polymorpha TaxID=45954 RepID=A0A9D4C8S5_DREPO|nr:hypothetical protein DPMN_061882 [Dreissena polymorpha]